MPDVSVADGGQVVALVGLVGPRTYERILRACGEFSLHALAVVELGKLGYAVIGAGNQLLYARKKGREMEFTRVPSLFTSGWKRRVDAELERRLSDYSVPRSSADWPL